MTDPITVALAKNSECAATNGTPHDEQADETGGVDSGEISEEEGGPREEIFRVSDGWTRIHRWKFARDYHITTVIIPGSVVEIGPFAFAHCKNLKKVDMGENVSYIGKYAFRKDNRPGEMADIIEVINRSVKPQMINADHFRNANIKNAALYVPEKSVDAYREADGWKEFGTISALEDDVKQRLLSSGFLNRDEINAMLAGIDTAPAIAADKADVTVSPDDYTSTVHLWIGTFGSRENLDEYADNSEYEWEYYGHLLGEDNFDEPPEEYGIGCGFCRDHGIMYEESADIVDDLVWRFFEKERPLAGIIAELPVYEYEVKDACEKNYPTLQKANSYIMLFGRAGRHVDFENAEFSKPIFYLGEFDFADIDDEDPAGDGRYDAWM